MSVTGSEPDVMAFALKWPDLSDVLTQGHARFLYDAPSDTMFIPFYVPAGPAVSVPVDQGDIDYVFLRVDVETQEVVGFQVEHFLSYAVGQMPDLIYALDLAELHGITRQEVNEMTRRLQPEHAEPADVAAVLGEIVTLAT